MSAKILGHTWYDVVLPRKRSAPLGNLLLAFSFLLPALLCASTYINNLCSYVLLGLMAEHQRKLSLRDVFKRLLFALRCLGRITLAATLAPWAKCMTVPVRDSASQTLLRPPVQLIDVCFSHSFVGK